MVLKTPHGSFPVARKGTVAVSVVKVKRHCRHKTPWNQPCLVPGMLTTIDHRVMPTHSANIRATCGGWAEWIATYDLAGNEIIAAEAAKEEKTL